MSTLFFLVFQYFYIFVTSDEGVAPTSAGGEKPISISGGGNLPSDTQRSGKCMDALQPSLQHIRICGMGQRHFFIDSALPVQLHQAGIIGHHCRTGR